MTASCTVLEQIVPYVSRLFAFQLKCIMMFEYVATLLQTCKIKTSGLKWIINVSLNDNTASVIQSESDEKTGQTG